MNVGVIERRDLDFAEEMQAVSRVGHADGFEIGGGEGGQISVGKVFDGTKVFWFVLWRLLEWLWGLVELAHYHGRGGA